ncbi:peptidoglycan-binding protein [Streptomyces scabiei]|uniref:helix-turn-helix domain-containing protein n=1 Tax=Streptomyces scabiei TaxID=1930 RepID=UPI001B30B2F4|nr:MULTISPECIES: helix-turn-helix domain-containing protein [Streptomyces]MBP5859242.1 helix-turn-helix domain-containing protein [Streptomyces sp. LBUM 1484]MBP5880638.1 helix-turn-helix domain-containing protein [Streptomyces sp. LBUM 1477]MBP5888468.1 helix-turn-helix domain-containing protein [Streptomyces sp. LBUM 1487]MBP5904494.1 helix-turn-helix domain-containing protein [Streptomyces sp. LBUM 1488]MBP5911842.1 helix-turn-helix domain-containing protein [Streptomyces sp. LBUM 1486]
MRRWKALPESLDPRIRQLVVQLRQLKDHSGLSLAALASRTSYSKSSWERFLNGKAVPPRTAVEAMADACGGDRSNLTALWEVATSTVVPDAAPPGAQEQPGPEAVREEERSSEPERPYERASPSERKGSRRPLPRGPLAMASATAVVVACAVAALVAARPWESTAEPGEQGRSTSVPTSTYSARTFPCYFTVRDGLLYAGHSTTLADEYGVGTTVEAVAEVQCLVKKHGFDPKGIDASFGPNTKAAVQRFQRSRGLEDDGIVGPMTWRELRKPSG